jgi:hypothetical protein
MDGLAILQKLGGGRLIDEMADALIKTADEVVATGKPGTVTITLKVSNKGIGDEFVMIEEQTARSSPKREPRGAYFYALDGQLYRDDPRQTRLDFRTVDRETGEIRERPEVEPSIREVLP